MKITTILPVYKNHVLFINNLKKNWQFIKDTELIIIDDASHEDIAARVKKISADIIFLENKKNLGFAKSVNKAASYARTDLIMLLNSDVQLIDNSYITAIQYFEHNPKIFGVSFLQIEKHQDLVGKNQIAFINGLIRHNKAVDLKVGDTAWLEGGSMIVRRDYFENLGGFDQLYAPFYWEDIDLSYRALKHGFKLRFEPGIKVFHNHQSTIGKYFSRSQIKRISYRNSFIFTWKNIHDRKLIFQHLMLLPFNIIYMLIRKEIEFSLGLIDAIRLLPQIIKKRKTEKKNMVIKDKDILKKVSDYV